MCSRKSLKNCIKIAKSSLLNRLSVLTEIHNRGGKDILIACVDALTGFANVIETVFPKNQVQLCIVHMVRNSVAFVPWQ